MKKVFNLSVILAVLMAAFSFTSCSDDDDDATVNISVDNNGKFESGAAATGSVTAEGEILTIVLTVADSEGNYSTNGVTSVNATLLKEAKGEKKYDFRIAGLSDGRYKLTVSDKDAHVAEKTFTVGNASSAEAETFELTIGGSKASAGSFISIKNKTVYNSSKVAEDASAANAVEIVFNGTKFISADKAENSKINANGNTAEINNTSNGCTFKTSTGYAGTIISTEAIGDESKNYIVTVSRTAAE